MSRGEGGLPLFAVVGAFRTGGTSLVSGVS